ncbi:MAG: acetyl-CoA carboxylase biotin carboxyl carrier protein subunit [Rickettsiales bacterium]|nr:acetyl-CoA carboxylase biotin carboxyl carrier protein subunit [Rickettsiales bacterium]OUV83280.1 MAG: hypothetical protein CBC91_00830 [Rickettsiales bacterium TMED131]|tara:strand:+ start:263 stop:715 length:453 start_codon:yes stop_codon:yes gene_type:complete
MFKFNIDKKAIENLIEILNNNKLTQIEVKDGNKSIKIAKENINMRNYPSENLEVETKKEVNVKKNIKEQIVVLENSIKAPMLGTLYYASSPKAQPFIKEGKKVKIGDTLFIIEAMKTMNQVKSDREGTVKKILVTNGMPVEFNQDLVIIE